MTAHQVKLIKRLIEAERHYYSQPDGFLNADRRLVEVGMINGVHPNAARSLVDAGIAEEDMPRNATEFTSTHVRLSDAFEKPMTPAQYRQTRRRLGTQAEVAARLQVSRVTVAKRETGKTVITNEAALALKQLKPTKNTL